MVKIVKPTTRTNNYIPFAALAVASVFLLVYAYVFTPNIPLQDQWDMIKMFESPTFANFFEQQNEHRIFFPRLIYFFLARMSGWSFQLETATSVLFLSALIFLLYSAFARSEKGALARSVFLLVLLAELSPIHHENILWGYQLQISLCMLLLFIAFFFSRAAFIDRRSLLIVISSLFVASFSFFSGLVGWGASLLAVIRARKLDLMNVFVFMISALFVFSFYFTSGYKFYGYVYPERVSFFGLLWQVPSYFLIYMGANFVPTWKVGPLLPYLLFASGAFGLVLFISGAYLIARTWKMDAQKTMLPYLMMAYSVGAAGITSMGRVDRGLSSALLSRYHELQMFYFIGFMWILILFLENKGVLRKFSGAISAILVVVLLSSWVSGIGLGIIKSRWAGYMERELKQNGASTPYSVLEPIFMDPPGELRGKIEFLMKNNYSVFR